jgi:predicted GNAT family acetyltransferase
MSTETEIEIHENAARSRFETTVDGHKAYVTFKREPGRIIFLHTSVPRALEGRGIAGKLAEHALEQARANRLAVVPLCPYVRSYIDRHPEYQDLVAAP